MQTNSSLPRRLHLFLLTIALLLCGPALLAWTPGTANPTAVVSLLARGIMGTGDIPNDGTFNRANRIWVIGDPKPAPAGVLFLGVCGACSRTQEPMKDTTPEPITVKPIEPPKPVPIRLGEPPRLKEEPR